MSYDHILVSRNGPIGTVAFNRPRVLNAFHNDLMHETLTAVSELNADDAVEVIVVRGEGRAFSAGFDLKASAERKMEDVQDWEVQMRLQFDFIMQFWHSPKPTIAAVHGHCLAGAFELALACDITVAAEGTKFGEPEVRFGTGIIAMLLPWVAGPKASKELLLTGNDQVSAADALRLGIVNRVVPADEVISTAEALATAMARASTRSVRMTKQAINRSYEAMGLSSALRTSLDIDVLLNSGSSPEKKEFARIRNEQGLKSILRHGSRIKCGKGCNLIPARRAVAVGVPLVPVDDLIQRRPLRRLELGAEGIGDRQQANLHDAIRNAQQLCRLRLVLQVQGGQHRPEPAGPQCQLKAPDRRHDRAHQARPDLARRIGGQMIDPDARDHVHRHILQALGQIMGGPVDAAVLSAIGGFGLFLRVGKVGAGALAVDIGQRPALFGIRDDNPAPPLPVAAGRRLQGQFQAVADHLLRHRFFEIEPLAHGARCR